jgi:hypothetical protein
MVTAAVPLLHTFFSMAGPSLCDFRPLKQRFTPPCITVFRRFASPSLPRRSAIFNQGVGDTLPAPPKPTNSPGQGVQTAAVNPGPSQSPTIDAGGITEVPAEPSPSPEQQQQQQSPIIVSTSPLPSPTVTALKPAAGTDSGTVGGVGVISAVPAAASPAPTPVIPATQVPTVCIPENQAAARSEAQALADANAEGGGWDMHVWMRQVGYAVEQVFNATTANMC